MNEELWKFRIVIDRKATPHGMVSSRLRGHPTSDFFLWGYVKDHVYPLTCQSLATPDQGREASQIFVECVASRSILIRDVSCPLFGKNLFFRV